MTKSKRLPVKKKVLLPKIIYFWSSLHQGKFYRFKFSMESSTTFICSIKFSRSPEKFKTEYFEHTFKSFDLT